MGPLYTTTATSYQVSVGVTYYTKKRERSIRTQHTNPLYPMIVLSPRESHTHRSRETEKRMGADNHTCTPTCYALVRAYTHACTHTHTHTHTAAKHLKNCARRGGHPRHGVSERAVICEGHASTARCCCASSVALASSRACTHASCTQAPQLELLRYPPNDIGVRHRFPRGFLHVHSRSTWLQVDHKCI